MLSHTEVKEGYHSLAEINKSLADWKIMQGEDATNYLEALERSQEKCGCNSCKGIRPGLPEVPVAAAKTINCQCNLCKANKHLKPVRRFINYLKADSGDYGGVEGVPNWGMMILALLAIAFLLFTMSIY